MHLTSWPSEVTELSPVLKRLHSLFPGPEDIQTHLLHLASNGEIHPHVDNLSASGSWILGVSLGAERLMHLEPGDENGDSYQVLLPSGSVYIQRYVPVCTVFPPLGIFLLVTVSDTTTNIQSVPR
jgi:alkylated DNA repair protein alkB family protein 7